MNVPMLDLKPQYQSLKTELQQAISDLCDSQMFILGPSVEAFEQHVAEYSQTAYAVAVSSGSDALLIALMAEGIGPNDEVITSPYTFFATAGAIARVGAIPVFVDIDPRYYTIDPAKIEEKVTVRTKAIIPVHLYGQMADMEPILDIAKRHSLAVIEDAAQAIGAEYKGHRAGSMGDYGCLSFFPSKNLGGFGDAGMVLTNSKERYQTLKSLRNHGMEPKYYHSRIGGNFRMDALQAVVLDIKLKKLDEWTAGRQNNASEYEKLLGDLSGKCGLPAVAPYVTRHVRNQYVIRLAGEKRQSVWDGFKKASIGCDVYYPVPLHLQKCFEYLGYSEGSFPESEKAAKETLAIPVYPELSEEQKQYVSATLHTLLS